MTEDQMAETDNLVKILTDNDQSAEHAIDRALDAIRKHLGMPIAYLSEFVGNESVFRHVAAPGLEDLIKVGDARSLDDVYCRHIVEGRLPNLIPDTSDVPLAADMPVTQAVPIGSHASIPILLDDGSVYGMFCCLSPEPNDSLNARDLETMKLFAGLATEQVRRSSRQKTQRIETQQRVRQVLDDSAFRIAFQPIVDTFRSQTLGYEALCRFQAEPIRTPDIWFAEAERVGLGEELEVAAIARALESIPLLEDGQYISVNASPKTIQSAAFKGVMKTVPPSSVLLEITEHAVIEDYDAFLRDIAPMRAAGLKLAIDDAGAGHSSLRHILQLGPDFLKLDMSLVRDVDQDISRRALISALLYYARETGAQIIAEGIETQAELDVLKRLGVTRGQGYFLGRPGYDLPDRSLEMKNTGS
ncbi:sensor domain-containing phosphodiesterase [Henriciella marina]|uniref:sensor domain-containing phosphodiesterase n=1 Tax=Henriciella marina TaxID=453851 RepID=UPI00037534D8|nr:EAL domain-containing protein [Henriciella marina]